jgi:hypothetical protein
MRKIPFFYHLGGPFGELSRHWLVFFLSAKFRTVSLLFEIFTFFFIKIEINFSLLRACLTDHIWIWLMCICNTSSCHIRKLYTQCTASVCDTVIIAKKKNIYIIISNKIINKFNVLVFQCSKNKKTYFN